MDNTWDRRRLLAWAGLAAAGKTLAGPADDAKPAAPEPPRLDVADAGAPLGQDVDGKAVRLSDFAGKPVLVFFWATWCPYCRSELPVLERLQLAAGEGMRIVAINVEERAVFKKVQRLLADSKMTHTYDPEEKAAKAFMKPASVPYTLLLRPDLSVAATHRGWDDSSTEILLKRVNAVFAEAKRG